MARNNVPTIPDDKINFFREQLYMELSNMFKWENLPQTVPQDYLERSLIRHGYVLYYEDENIGQDILKCEVIGYNRHDLPVTARATITTQLPSEKTYIERNIKRLADSKNAVERFDPTKDGVLIQNMEHGQNVGHIVEHYATRLALAQQAFDTNLMWANVPYIFQVDNDETRLSIERMFTKIFTGEPFLITDKSLFQANKDRTGIPTGIKFIGKELMDVQNEIMMKFKQQVGFNTAGVDKAERVNTLEIQSNDQHTQTVLQIMLGQRQKACESINAFFKTNNISVGLLAPPTDEYEEEERMEDDGTNNGGTGKAADD